MVIYSVTVSLDPEIESQWKEWMLSTHVPEVMSKGYFTDKRITKVLSGTEGEAINYNIQYLSESTKNIHEFQMKHDEYFQSQSQSLFKDKYLAFRTLLEVIE